MWRGWNVRIKIVVLTMGVVLPVMAAATALTVRMSRTALEADIRNTGLAMARELAASAENEAGAAGEQALQQEVSSLFGKGGVARDVAVYAVRREGLVARARGGEARPPGPEDEIAAREVQEVVVVRSDLRGRVLRVAVPVRREGRSIGVVSIGLPLERVDALGERAERQAIALGVAAVVLIVGSLSAFMNRALAAPLRRLVSVMRRAEEGDLGGRAPEDRQDEVGQVGRGLNRMLERVGSFQAELARRVAEATVELRAVNQRLYAARQQVGRNERLAAAGELAATMAHDVGTPLTAVSGHLQFLEEEVTDPQVKERLRMIQGHLDRAVSAARRFLDAARPEPSRAPVDLNALLEDLLVLASPEAQRKGIAVTRRAPEGLPRVVADEGQMQELFLNLISNALEAIGTGGGTVSVATEAVPGAGGAPAVRVTVADTGPGMPPEVTACAFDPFFTTRASQGGTGLGLAICRRIAEDHGGTIRLESEPGRGTRAIVELPAPAAQRE
ncbi:MAG TPA: ATP-binding protein [Candidatus Sulfotelmatobacter sp.]|nr:ATP-binding protein [Candidatus Sulfotelmatobacter sp.]